MFKSPFSILATVSALMVASSGQGADAPWVEQAPTKAPWADKAPATTPAAAATPTANPPATTGPSAADRAASQGLPWTEYGSVTGVVVNGSKNNQIVPKATVVLRVQNQGVLAPVMEVEADEQGRFKFENLPLNEQLTFLPGANHDGIHYPGKRHRLSVRQKTVEDQITIYETSKEPCPLVATRHEIELKPEDGALRVSERLLVRNPTPVTYIGKTATPETPAVTLHLSIPGNFDKVTFDKEFFGRTFQVAGQGIETQVPWTPGEREIRFTYRLPMLGDHWQLQRPLDLPCESVQVRVPRDSQAEIACNLPLRWTPDTDSLKYEQTGSASPAGFTVEIKRGVPPVPWNNYARYGAAGVLAVLLSLIGIVVWWRKRAAEKTPATGAATVPLPTANIPPTNQDRRRAS